MSRYEVLSEDAMATIESGWRRLLEEIGVAFNHPEALRLFRAAGQTVEGEDVRREATFDDYTRFTKLAQVFDDFDTAGGLVVEPNDVPLDSRHLDMQLALLTLTDKPYGGSQVSLTGALDSLAMAEIVFGGPEALAREPALYGI